MTMTAILLGLIAAYIWSLLVLAPEPEALSVRRAFVMPFFMLLVLPVILSLQFSAAALIGLTNLLADIELELPL